MLTLKLGVPIRCTADDVPRLWTSVITPLVHRQSAPASVALVHLRSFALCVKMGFKAAERRNSTPEKPPNFAESRMK
jgi:hypothetical protein